MKTTLSLGLLLVTGTLIPLAHSSDVILSGKSTSTITAFVKNPNNLFVTDSFGGWFDQGLEMQQPGAWNSPYQVQARLRIVSSSGVFQVRMDNEPQIRHIKNTTMLFRQPSVSLGLEGEPMKPLAVARNTEFKNPKASNMGEDSTGYYQLAVSALPPAGSFKDTSGTYSGELSLTFEPVAVDP
ncbi:hypothetical protein [Pseudomonas piscis]|uniref:hypothetical protein n=1 Tax=Pseudomonas piscis TaxID=2614538 RepID=UPI0021D56B14|nr:hypothetical protein [Pseudomonas piscis]MCU7649743.1 hypothetical protein [Pseudomonas piscis]